MQVSDGEATFAKSFTITIDDGQEPPTPEPAAATTDEDTAATVTLSASDPEGDDVMSFAYAPGGPADRGGPQ